MDVIDHYNSLSCCYSIFVLFVVRVGEKIFASKAGKTARTAKACANSNGATDKRIKRSDGQISQDFIFGLALFRLMKNNAEFTTVQY